MGSLSPNTIVFVFSKFMMRSYLLLYQGIYLNHVIPVAAVSAGNTWVLGQNGSGQNGTDKMVWTKWYTDKMVLDKMVRTKWYGQNGMDKTLTIKSSINTLIPLP